MNKLMNIGFKTVATMRQQEFMSYDPELWRLVPTTLRCQVLFLAEVKSAYLARHFANPSLTRTKKTGPTCDSEPFRTGYRVFGRFQPGWAAIITTWRRLSCHHHRLAQAELPSPPLGSNGNRIIFWRGHSNTASLESNSHLSITNPPPTSHVYFIVYVWIGRGRKER